MPPRESASEYRNHKILSNVIEEVLRCPSGRLLVPDLANSAGFSRFHLTRMFHETAEETLDQFLRRVRMERAAYLLLHSDQRIYEISLSCGYRSPEAFSRAFRQAYGCLPSEAAGRLSTWELPSASDLHWKADWVLNHHRGDLEEAVVSMPTRHACVWRAIGDYGNLAESWERFGAKFGQDIPDGGRFITVYLDNFWSHPVTRTMRADVGWLCRSDDMPPKGMKKITLFGGNYATTRFVDREERSDAWSYMLGRYLSPGNRSPSSISYDEYLSWPLPFDAVKTRIRVGLTQPERKAIR